MQIAKTEENLNSTPSKLTKRGLMRQKEVRPPLIADKRSQAKSTKKLVTTNSKSKMTIDETIAEIKASMGIVDQSDGDAGPSEPIAAPSQCLMKTSRPVAIALPSLAQNSSCSDQESADWLHTLTRDRAQLQSLSAQKRQLKLKTLQKTFDRSALADPEKLTELRKLVARVSAKIECFDSPISCEKYLRLNVKPELSASELQEDSELMEDLYKILPLTVETVFDNVFNALNCQFDSMTDLRRAEKILKLVLAASELRTGTAKKQKSLLQTILQAIWCRKRSLSTKQDEAKQRMLLNAPEISELKQARQLSSSTFLFPRPKDIDVVRLEKVKVIQPVDSLGQRTPLLFSNKKGVAEFEDVLEQVKDALNSLDDYDPRLNAQRNAVISTDQLEAQLEKNPNLIIPFVAEDDCESDFTLLVKKCRKPRTAKPKINQPACKEEMKAPLAKVLPPLTTTAGKKRIYKKAVLPKEHSDSFIIPPFTLATEVTDQQRPIETLNLTEQTTTSHTAPSLDTNGQIAGSELNSTKRKKKAIWNTQASKKPF